MKNHVVNKVSLRLPAPDYENARKLQQNAQKWSSNHLPGILEKSLDEFSKNGNYLFIDKIEIDLNVYPWQLSENDWNLMLKKSISDSLITQLPYEIILKQWVFYLGYGVFERNAVIGKIFEIENYFLRRNFEFSLPEKQMLNRIFSSEAAIRRLFLLHSENFSVFFLEQYFGLKKEDARQFYRLLKKLLQNKQQEIIGLIRKLSVLVIQNRLETIEKLVGSVVQNPETIENDETIWKKSVTDENREVVEKETETGVWLHCENAGLVLLLPFIKPFFENIGLIKDDFFADEGARTKACNVLHFLATGKTATEESELLLPKILCGTEIAEYVEPVAIQDEYIGNEANELLKSVIEYWEVLKNTSVEALRETFLQRDGQIKIDSVYLLQVSNSGVDILLGKIPWGFRNYKLPWMHKAIVTEWQ